MNHIVYTNNASTTDHAELENGQKNKFEIQILDISQGPGLQEGHCREISAISFAKIFFFSYLLFWDIPFSQIFSLPMESFLFKC